MRQWADVRIVPAEMLPDWTRPIHCEFGDCHGDGVWIVYRTSTLTGNSYNTRACDSHAAGWRKPG